MSEVQNLPDDPVVQRVLALSRMPYALELEQLVTELESQKDRNHGLVWDTRVVQRNTPEALYLLLTGWEVSTCDALPRRREDGSPVVDQILHLVRRVPASDLITRSKAVLDAVANGQVNVGRRSE